MACLPLGKRSMMAVFFRAMKRKTPMIEHMLTDVETALFILKYSQYIWLLALGCIAIVGGMIGYMMTRGVVRVLGAVVRLVLRFTLK